MVFSDLKKFGLHNCLKPQKRRTAEQRKIAKDKILKNKAFIQFCLKDKKTKYFNTIIEPVIDFVILCNEAFYFG